MQVRRRFAAAAPRDVLPDNWWDACVWANHDWTCCDLTLAGGGEPAAIPGHTRYYPSFLPDGRHYLHTVGRQVFIGSFESADHQVLINDAGNAKYADGHVFFVRKTTLYAQPFDPATLTLRGSPTVVAERLLINDGSGATFAGSSRSMRPCTTPRERGKAPASSWLGRSCCGSAANG